MLETDQQDKQSKQLGRKDGCEVEENKDDLEPKNEMEPTRKTKTHIRLLPLLSLHLQ